MKLAYIRWRDASHGMEEWDIANMGLSELEEVGFLLKEDADSVTLVMERIPSDPEPKTARLWLTVPRVNIIEYRTFRLPKPRSKSCRLPKSATSPTS